MKMNMATMMKLNELQAAGDIELPTFHFDNIEWTDEPYGYDHGVNVARLALVILSHDFAEENKFQVNRWAVYTAGLFHDLDRKAQEDEGHALRSADACEKFLRTTEYWSDEKLRELTCQLIANHHGGMDNHPLMKSLRDADALDASRIQPNTREGLSYFKDRTLDLQTMFAKSPTNQRTYMEFRGW